jgi:hypothetical protein
VDVTKKERKRKEKKKYSESVCVFVFFLFMNVFFYDKIARIKKNLRF